MAQSRFIDPQTGDYVITNGAPRSDATVASEVVLALRSRRGSAGAAPEFGSRLHTIRKLTATSRALAAVYAREAIQHLIDRGEVRNPSFDVTLDDDANALRVVVSYTNAARRSQSVPVTVPIT